MAAAPNPERRVTPGFGLLPKVFIVYPHNPDSYTQIDPTITEEEIRSNPGVSIAELEERMRMLVVEHERKREESIQRHKELVRKFATFLQSTGIAVAYDELLNMGSANTLKWCQQQIDDSDYIILIVTDSLKEFLEDEVPPELEPIFVGDYLYNLVHSNDKKFLPVFLNKVKNTEVLPVALHMCQFYEIWTEFDVQVQRRDDLHSLYSLLTNQSQTQAPPSQGPIKLPKKKRIGGGSRSSAGQGNAVMTPHHLQMFTTLCSMPSQVLNEIDFAKISDKRDISMHWKQLAIHLGLTEAEVERCEGRGRGNDSEVCLQMLITWKNKCAPNPVSLMLLADTVYNKYRNVTVFEHLCRVYNLC